MRVIFRGRCTICGSSSGRGQPLMKFGMIGGARNVVFFTRTCSW